MQNTTTNTPTVSRLQAGALGFARNIRQDVAHDDIETMKSSIKASGVLQNLIGAPDAQGNIAIFAGGTRLQAIQELIREGALPADFDVPVMVCADIEPDGADATAIAMTENMIRAEMDYIDECLAMNQLARARRSEDEIAAIFGYRPKTVRERLMIANLIPQVHELVRAKTRTLDWARALTLADASMQAKICEDVAANPTSWQTGEAVRRYLTRATVPAENALFEMSAYTGQIITDMFEGDKLCDLDQFWTLQNAAIDDLVAEVEAEGWSSVSVTREPFAHWNYEDSQDKTSGQAFIEVMPNGAVTVFRGKTPIAEAGAVAPTLETAPAEDVDEIAVDEVRPTPSLLDYAAAHRSAMLQTKIAADFRTALEYQVLAMCGHRGAPYAIQTFSMPGGDEGRISEAFRQVYDVNQSVSDMIDAGGGTQDARDRAIVQIVRSLPHDKLATLFTMMTAQRAGQVKRRGLDDDADALTNVFGADIDIRSLWTPDESFFAMMSSEDLRRLSAALLHDGTPRPDRFAGSKKADLVAALARNFSEARDGLLTGEVAERLNTWVPGILTFPAEVRTAQAGAGEGDLEDLDALLFAAEAGTDAA